MDIKKAQSLIDEHVKDLIDLGPHCGAKVHIEKLWSDFHSFRNKDKEFYVIFRCKPCKKLILKTYFFKQNVYRTEEDLSQEGWDKKFPITFEDELNEQEKEYIPANVLSDYEEGLMGKSIGANRASCSMFRRALQSALIIIGANPNLDLIQQIDSLENLPKDIKDWVHQIRIFGNWGAHPDKDNLKEIDSNDVVDAHDFISKFFIYMFIMPEKVKSSRAKRDEKLKKNTKATTNE